MRSVKTDYIEGNNLFSKNDILKEKILYVYLTERMFRI